MCQLGFTFDTIIAQVDSIYIKSNCSNIHYDSSLNVYIKNNKPVNGLAMCSDTFVFRNTNGIESTNIINSLKKFINGKIILEKSFYENGNLRSEAVFDTTTNQMIPPYYYYNENGLLNKSIVNVNDSIILEREFSISNLGKEKYSGLIIKNGKKMPLHIEFDFNTNFPRSIVSYSADRVEGPWILFNGVDDSIDEIRLIVSNKNIPYQENFEVTMLEYFENFRVKKITRKYDFLELVQEIEFDVNGELIYFSIYHKNELIYSK